MLVLAHRGASAAALENTARAFRLADEMGADGVELDVRATDDGRLLVRHDPLPADPSPEEIAAPLDLDAALDACGPRMLVNVDVKTSEAEARLDPATSVVDRAVEVLERRGRAAADRWLVSSFSWAALDHCRRRAPWLRTAWITLDAGDETIRRVASGGHVALHPWFGAVTPDAVARCHAAGLAVHTWTCNERDQLAAVAAMGVDGVFTDVPDVALEAAGRTGGPPTVRPRWGRPA